MNEFAMILRYFSAFGAGDHVALSVGDDAAALRLDDGAELIVSTDTSLSGVHFPADFFPEDIAYRSVASAASDLAAMGAEPLGMTLALTLPDADELWLHGFSEGLARASDEFDLPLVGGDTTRGPLSLTVTVLGQCPTDEKLLRSGAQPGDLLCVSGSLGDAAYGLSLLQGERRGVDLDLDDQDYLVARFSAPRAQISLGRRLRGAATSCIDVSDGLLQDAHHIASASGCKLVIESGKLPVSSALRAAAGRDEALALAVAGGDDYELLFTVPTTRPIPEGCTLIGRVTTGEGVDCDFPSGGTGYEHFH